MIRARLFLMILGFVGAAGWSAPAGGIPWPDIDSYDHPGSIRVKAQRCIQTKRKVGRETLVNRCNSCRIVSLQRTRPGGSFPTARTYRIPAGSNMQLSFRGPGYTKILADTPCDDLSNIVKDDDRSCARLKRSKTGDVVLANICRVCRATVVERVGSDGSRRRQTFTIDSRLAVPIEALGAT